MESRSRLCKTALIVFCLVACELVAQAQQPDLSVLNSDDRLSVELACVIDKGNGPAPYHACLQRHLGALSGSKSPGLPGLNATTISARGISTKSAPLMVERVKRRAAPEHPSQSSIHD
jgi:hypothetical protein